MLKQIAVRVATTCALAAATIGFAGPAAAATETVWVMPNVRNMLLQHAVNAVLDVTGPVDLDITPVDLKNGQDVINLTNWQVCYQSPRAGSEISQTKKRVALYVKRFNQAGCS